MGVGLAITLPLAGVALMMAVIFVPSHVNETPDPVDNLVGSFRPSSGSPSDLVRSSESFDEVVGDSKRVCHGGQGRIDGTDTREEARIHHVQVVEIVGLT